MEHFFKHYWSALGRPLEVYAEMYGRARDYHKIKQASAKQGFFLTLAVAFFIVAGTAMSFRAAEHSLKRAMKIRYAFLPAQSEARALESASASIETQTGESMPATDASSFTLPASGLLRDAVLQYVALGARAVFGVETAHAAGAEYAAHLADAPPDIELLPSERRLIRIKYTNEGSYNWRREGRSFISLYARPVHKKSSAFYDASWMSATQVARIMDPLVGPGRVGFVEFYIRAPHKVGAYAERFQLAAENTAWVNRSAVTIIVRVVKEKTRETKNIAPMENTNQTVNELSSTNTPDARVRFPINLWGDKTISAENSLASGIFAEIAVSSTVAIGEGMVTSTALEKLHATSTPIIRVGLYRTDEPIEFISDNDYELRDADGAFTGQIPAGQPLKLFYDAVTKMYTAQNDKGYAESALPLRLVPRVQESDIFTLQNLNNFRGRDTKVNYNQFRGTMEIRFAARHVWVINELPIEQYLNGLAEAGEGAPVEFLKALTIAARSFAYEAIQNPTKHPRSQFYVDAEYDQIYKGAVREKINPSWVKAAEETRGVVVTYKDKPVTTPYFAQSAGRTRAWSEVWRGAHPWLVSVKTLYDKGRKRLGHGVGMSTHDAMARAKKGATAEEILRYYYRGTEVRKIW